MKKARRPTWRAITEEVRAAGGVFVRQGATAHEVWKLPNGETVILQRKHLSNPVPSWLVKSIRSQLKSLEGS